jgi:ABC-2 type transport system ATP-binding protein
LAGRIAVVDRGKVIAEGTPGELKSSVGAGTVHLRLREAAQKAEAERVLNAVLDTRVQPESDPLSLTARVAGSAANEQAARALSELARAGVLVDDFSLGQPSLDEVFLALTDHPAVPAGDVRESAELEATR